MQSLVFSRHQWLIASLLYLLTASAIAQSGRCDNELTEAQETQRSFCEAHASCRMVFALFDSCSAVSKFLDDLTRSDDNPAPQAVNDAGFAEALEDLGVPKPSISSCTIAFDMIACKQYLGVEQAPIKASPPDRKPDPAQEDYRLSAQLFREWEDAKLSKGEYSYAKTMLESCATARQSTDREKICADAQRKVDACNSYRQNWLKRREGLITRVELSGALGAIKVLPTLEMPNCPYTLPQTFMTPEQALAKWREEDTAATRVEPLRRELDPEELALFQSAVTRGVAEHEANLAKQRADVRQRLAATKRQQDIAAGLTLDGRWIGDNGHSVDIVTNANGFCVTGTGASGTFCFNAASSQLYRYTFPDGSVTCDIQVENKDYLIYNCTNLRNFIGFRRVGNTNSAYPVQHSQPVNQPAVRTCTASKAWCDCMFSGGSQESCANSW